MSWHPCVRPSWGVWTWRIHLQLPHFLGMGCGALTARPTLPLATTPSPKIITLACSVWVKGLDQMFQDLFFSSFQILKLYIKLIAIFLNQEKLHLNYVLFKLHSGTGSNDLGGKDRMANCYDICVTSLTPVIDQCRETVTTMHFVFLDYLVHKYIMRRMCQRESVLLKVNRIQ